MPDIIYIGPVRPGVELDAYGLAEFGVPISVDVETARSLLVTSTWSSADVSDATVEEVLADVGDDPDKAGAALALEHARAKPRKTLLDALNAIIEAADSGEEA